MPEESCAAGQYRCPGDTYPISRAVHLGRLAGFYPPCRQCPHRDDQEPLSPRQKRRLLETRRRAEPYRLFHEEGVAGVYGNQLTLADAVRLATAMGFWLRKQPDSASPPVALVAGDGRGLSAEAVSAVVEGFRWSGCHTIEISAATAACAAMAVSHLACDGGILVGNPAGSAHTAGMKFWACDGRPLSRGGGLEALEEIFLGELDRPTRRFGSLRRIRAEVPFLAELAGDYHGLRPLRLVLRTTSQPLRRYLESLLASTACECLDCPAAERLPQQIQQRGAHFGANIEDDGECCQIYDERGQAVAPARLAALVVEELSSEGPAGCVVLDQTIAKTTRLQFGSRVQTILSDSACRAEMHRSLQQHAAIFGGNASGRFWYQLGPSCWAADALRTLTLLLRHLSRSDRPLSSVLDSLEARNA